MENLSKEDLILKIKDLEKKLVKSNELIEILNETIKVKDKTIKIQDKTIGKKDQTIKNKDSTIEKKDNEIKIYKEVIEKQKNTIKILNETINIYKNKNVNNATNENSNEQKVIPIDQITCVFFTSLDGKFNYPIPCSQNDVFADIEKKLYLQYPEYLETNNYFIANGIQILRFKTIKENKIVSGLPVILCNPSN